MRILHIADTHLGAAPYGSPALARDMDRALLWMARYAVENEVDVVIIAGDLFDSPTISPDDLHTMICFGNILADGVNGKIPVLLIEGNHDSTTRGHSTARRGKTFSEVIPGIMSCPRSDSGLVEIGIQRKSDGEVCRFGLINNQSGPVTREILDLIPPDYYDVLVMHQSMEGAIPEVASPELLIESVVGKCRYAALGDIHLQWKTRRGNTTIAYPGPSSWLRSSEIGQEGGLLVEITEGSVMLMPVMSPGRVAFTISVTMIEGLDDVQAIGMEDLLSSLRDDPNVEEEDEMLPFGTCGRSLRVPWGKVDRMRHEDMDPEQEVFVRIVYDGGPFGDDCRDAARALSSFLQDRLPGEDPVVRTQKSSSVESGFSWVDAGADEDAVSGNSEEASELMVKAISNFAETLGDLNEDEFQRVVRGSIAAWNRPDNLVDTINQIVFKV
jgi:DNA repair exonuclease SbcCD nuclease subunit